MAMELAKVSGTSSEDELKEKLKANPEDLEVCQYLFYFFPFVCYLF